MFTLAEITSDCIAQLGTPPTEILSVKDVARAVRSSLGFYLNQVAQSTQNQRIEHFDFTVGANGTKTLANLSSGASPAWLEVQFQNGWSFVPAVNLDNLTDYGRRGLLVCAFYREDGLHTVKLSLNEILLHGLQTYRLWFDPDPITIRGFEDETGLPPVFNQMVTDRACLDLIPNLMSKAAQFESTEKPVSQIQILAWRAMEMRLREKLAEWQGQWREFLNGSRGAQRGRQRSKILRGVRF